MKKAIDEIRKEHKQVLKQMSEIELLIGSSKPNYVRVEQTLSKLNNFLNNHESKEKMFLLWLEENNLEFPTEIINNEHKTIKGYWEVINRAFSSKNKNKIKLALENDCKMLFDFLRKHMRIEEEFFDNLKSDRVI